MDSALFIGLIRHVLQLGGGYLVGKGVIDADGANTAVGALVSLSTVAWFAVDRWRGKK
jgi:hypothetical protein